MITYDSCPEKLPMLPDYPTLDGKRLSSQEVKPISFYLPTLVAIGLGEALLEVEEVLAWNQTEKHPNAKWKSKSIAYHDAKGVSHLNKAQCGDLVDSETKCRHRAHAICRLMMSLQHELNQSNDT